MIPFGVDDPIILEINKEGNILIILHPKNP